VKVTLASGAVIRVRSSDVNDVRLTFLRTELARARSAAASVASPLRDCAPSSEAAQATEPATSAMSAPGTSERFAPTGAEQPVQAGAPPPGVQIQGDPANAETAKADFDWGPWLSRFKAQIKRCWFVPYAVMGHHGHVVLTFNVHRDGSITDLRILKPSNIDAFTNSAFYAIKKSNPTIPLPPEYPDDRMFFTVTLYFNETPPGG
jgi:TonB family protein